jgi:hypothetical protein
MTNRKWSTTFDGTSLGSAATLVVNTNLSEASPTVVYYFQGDYTHPATGLTNRITANITLSLVKTGTNAVWVQMRGRETIKQATGATKSVAVMAADLVRSAGVDTSGVTYRFFEANGVTQIWNTSPFTTEYGLKTTATGSAPTGSTSDINVNLPATGAWSSHNTLVIRENAVNSMEVYRCEAKDNDGTIYQTYFTIYDVSDPYTVTVNSSAGDKLQNGVGSTSLTPNVFNGSVEVTDLTSWTFTWTLFNRNGKRTGFVDTTKTALAGGRIVTANTAGTATVFTFSGAAIAFVAGDLIKVVAADSTEKVYEVVSFSGSTVTIRTPSTNTWLNFTDFPAPVTSEFVNGKLFALTANGLVTSSAAAAVALTGDDVDVKCNIVVSANRP